MTTAIVLGLVCIALVVLVAWREREHRAQVSELLDRIQAPEAAHIAAVERAIGPREPFGAPDPYTELVPVSDDVALEQLLSGGIE